MNDINESIAASLAQESLKRLPTAMKQADLPRMTVPLLKKFFSNEITDPALLKIIHNRIDTHQDDVASALKDLMQWGG